MKHTSLVLVYSSCDIQVGVDDILSHLFDRIKSYIQVSSSTNILRLETSKHERIFQLVDCLRKTSFTEGKIFNTVDLKCVICGIKMDIKNSLPLFECNQLLTEINCGLYNTNCSIKSNTCFGAYIFCDIYCFQTISNSSCPFFNFAKYMYKSE